MKINQFVALLVRFLSVYLFVIGMHRAEFALLGYLTDLRDAGIFLKVIYLSVFSAIFLIAGLLWKYPLFIANKIIPINNDKEVNISLKFEELQIIGYSLIGMWVVVDAFSRVVVNIINLLEVGQLFENLRSDYLLINVIKLMMGLFIIAGAKGVSRIINNLRGKLK